MRSSTNKLIKKFDPEKYIVYIIFLLVLVIFSVWLGGSFFSGSNLLNIIRQTSSIAIMAVALTFVLATGGIDLTVSGVIPLSSAFAAMLLIELKSIPLTLLIVILFGAVVGLINGLLITKLNMPPFLVTLGMQFVLKGTAMWVTKTQAIPIYDENFNFIFGSGDVGGIPMLAIWIIIFLILGHFALRHLSFGRKVLAVGGNKISAKYTGINVDRVIILTYVISAIVAVIGGMLYTGRMQASRYNLGEGVEMDVVAAVVLGGTSMYGGTGNVIGAVVGALLIGMINNGLIIGGLDVSQQTIVRGAIIIIAVAVNSLTTLRRKV